ncbi:L,D-transpeptidase family protein [Eremococcus coleocola]|uniref:ErfK/YbiS/YcfS/YnhG n=1 Tax=Eremococcus coleocola ACS-139-V-Col8 TaxID=908337 RepID=E4KQV1_9LACT|nr:L,D-transpeptidase family protein [Eremococcus coleocola]EFR30791.1 ErfK/YbiS/YcfS/YnhG [Eremococcus coleocola ACS-139-V-Col8]
MKKLVLSLVGLVLLLVVGYGAGIGYYADKFQANTKFGSIDVSNLSLAQAQEKIKKEVNNRQVTINENGKQLGTIKLSDLKPSFDLEDGLKQVFNSQNPNAWVTYYFSTTKFDNQVTKEVKVDKSQLGDALAKLDITNEDRTPTKEASIEYTEADGYHVVPAEMGNQFDVDSLSQLILDNIKTGKSSVDVKEAYIKPNANGNDKKIEETMAAIDKAASTKITLEIDGDKVEVPKEEILKAINFNDANEIVYDQATLQEYVKTLNDKYATFDKTRKFKSTLQGEVDVLPGTLGWSIDSESEAAQLAADLEAGKDVSREPAIVGTGYGSTGDDIGSTYVEIDMANQTMFIYKDGQIVLETPIVTGRVGTDTIPGAYSVWDKQKDAVLKGYNSHTQRDYAQPVAYWMPFDTTGQGIHDASWQSSFGGDTYLNNGSLGCINTPPDAMGQVFEIVEVGTPVIVF